MQGVLRCVAYMLYNNNNDILVSLVKQNIPSSKPSDFLPEFVTHDLCLLPSKASETFLLSVFFIIKNVKKLG